MSKQFKKVVIFIPKTNYNATYDGKFVESFVAAKDYLLTKYHEIPFEFNISQYFSHTTPLDANRNECVSMAIKNEIDISIFLDTDHILPADVLYKLLVHDKPIVAGVYYSKGEPHIPIVYKENKELSKNFDVFNSIYYIGDTPIYDYKELFHADMLGAGCFAVSLDVLKKLKKPYFKYREIPEALLIREEKFAHSGNQGLDQELDKVFSDWTPSIKFKIDNDIQDVSEDVNFWRNVRQNTDEVPYVDPTIVMPHGPLHVWVDDKLSKVYFNNMNQSNPTKAQELKDKCRVEPIKKNS